MIGGHPDISNTSAYLRTRKRPSWEYYLRQCQTNCAMTWNPIIQEGWIPTEERNESLHQGDLIKCWCLGGVLGCLGGVEGIFERTENVLIQKLLAKIKLNIFK